VNTRAASRRRSGSESLSRSAAMMSGGAPSAVSRAVCMATQTWQPFLAAMAITTTSRATGSSVPLSKIALSLANPSSR
jgi:hypothetical protein